MTKKEYLENRKKKTDHKVILENAVLTLEELNSVINRNIKELGDDASDIMFYIDAQDSFGMLIMEYKRFETKEETERRFFNKKMVYENAIKNLEHLITLNPKEAVEIIKNKGLI